MSYRYSDTTLVDRSRILKRNDARGGSSVCDGRRHERLVLVWDIWRRFLFLVILGRSRGSVTVGRSKSPDGADSKLWFMCQSLGH